MKVIDLAKFDRELPNSHFKTKSLIRSTIDLHSAHTDLALAGDFILRAIEFQEQAEKFPPAVVEDCTIGLICASVVFYARATKSESHHRITFDMRRHFDAEEKKQHELLCSLRDDAIAHYGPGPITASLSMRSDRAFFPEGVDKLLFTSRQLSGSLSICHRIRQQVQRALLISQRLFEERDRMLVDALHKLDFDDPVIKAAWDGSQTTLEDTLGDEKMADQILRGPHFGHLRFSGSLGAIEPASE